MKFSERFIPQIGFFSPDRCSTSFIQCVVRRIGAALSIGLVAFLSFGSDPVSAAVVESWVQRYNGSGKSNDFARAVAVDGSGNVVVTGNSFGTNDDYYTAKYAANGALLWERRYDGPANRWDYATALALDGSGNVVVTGFSNNGTNNDYYTAKYAATTGALLWERRYNGPVDRNDEACAVIVDSSGNAVVTGFSFNEDNQDFYTAKYAAADGALLWEKRYDASDDVANALAVDSNGDVIVTGSSRGQQELYTAKYAATDGTLLWQKRHGGGGNHGSASAVAVDGNGDVIVTGWFSVGAAAGDYYTAKYAAVDGALLWEKYYNGPGNSFDIPQAIAVDGSNDVVVTGYSVASGPPYEWDYYTAKYTAADGALLWEKRYNGPANGDDYAYAVAVDVHGNAVVSGNSWNGTNSDYCTVKYAAADGALLWEKRYNGPANGNDTLAGPQSHGLAIALDGMIVVTGSSSGDYATVAYRETLRISALAHNGSHFRLTVEGVSDVNYTVVASTNLVDWSAIGPAVMTAPGQFHFGDPNADQFSARFYRLRSP